MRNQRLLETLTSNSGPTDPKPTLPPINKNYTTPEVRKSSHLLPVVSCHGLLASIIECTMKNLWHKSGPYE